MSDKLNLDDISPDVFDPTPKDQLCLNARYKETYYPFSQIEMDISDLFQRAEVICHQPNIPISSWFDLNVYWTIHGSAEWGFSGKMLWEVYLPRPIQRGRRQRLQSHNNPYIQFMERSTAGDIDPDLFPQTVRDGPTGAGLEYEEAFYHFAIVRYRVNDYFQGSREIRPSPRECASSTIAHIAECLIKSLAILGVAGHAQFEVCLPKPVRRGPRPIEVNQKRLIRPSKRV